jgi:hypothetical protein
MSGWNLRSRLISPSTSSLPTLPRFEQPDPEMNDNESPPQSPSEYCRLDRVEPSLATLIEQLSRLPIASVAPVGPNIPAVPAMPAQPAEVAEIITRNERYAEVLSVNTYRLRDKSHILKLEEVATLTGLAKQVRPRLEGVIFTGEPALAVLPFLAQVVNVANPFRSQ